jgi:hypothetical protein
LEGERESQADWLKTRAAEVAGAPAMPLPQRSLFDAIDPATPTETPAWQTSGDPLQRLAAFNADRQQSASARAEAEGVLRTHEQRMSYLAKLLDLREPEIIPLGVLMLIPEAKHGA